MAVVALAATAATVRPADAVVNSLIHINGNARATIQTRVRNVKKKTRNS